VYVDVVHDASWAVGSRQAVGVRLCGEPMTQAGYSATGVCVSIPCGAF
jgi:hypothetical protein